MIYTRRVKKDLFWNLKIYGIIQNLVWTGFTRKSGEKFEHFSKKRKHKSNAWKLNQSEMLMVILKAYWTRWKTWKFKFSSLFKTREEALILWVFIVHCQLQAYWWFLNLHRQQVHKASPSRPFIALCSPKRVSSEIKSEEGK